MPKGTVVNIPADLLPMSKPAPKRPDGNFRWGRFADVFFAVITKLLGRETLLLNTVAFLLGRVTIMGELAPFGLAYFVAVAQVAKQRSLTVAICAITGVLSTGRYPEAGVYLVAILLYFRFVDKLTRLEQRFQLAPVFVFGVVVIGGGLLTIWHDATLYNVLAVMFDAALCTVLAYIYMSAVAVIVSRTGERQITGEMMMCLIILLAAAVAGFGTSAVMGYSLRNIAGSFLIMALAGSTGLGASVGVAIGLVVGLTDGNASLMISLYAIAGLLAGTFRALGKFAVVLGFLIGNAITVLYFAQTAQLVQVLTEASLGAALFMAIPAAWLGRWVQGLADKQAEFPQNGAVIAATAKLNNMADMFSGLAAAFGQSTAETRARIREEEIARVLASIGEQLCGPCQRRAVCWDKEFYRTYQAMLDAMTLAEGQCINAHCLPKYLKDSCMRAGDLADTINHVTEQTRNFSFWQKKIADTRQMITEQLKAMGSIAASLAQEIAKEPACDLKLASVIQEKAALIGCTLTETAVSGKKGATTVDICKEPCSGNRECLNTILPLTTNLLKEKMTLHAECGKAGADKMCRLHLQVTGQYGVVSGMAALAKEPGGVCGDTCAVVPLPEGKVALLLSDGMGSGSQAAGESATAVRFLEKLLTVGFDVDVAVKTVNSLLMLRMPDESFATVDMVIVDTYAGEGEFLKIGSAPSFVKRVKEVAVIKSASLPIGILNQIEIEPVKWTLAPGDIIVMVSDGVVEVPQRGLDKETWVANFLRRLGDEEPQVIADKLLQQAVDMTGGSIRDDMTVLVAKITERQGLEQ